MKQTVTILSALVAALLLASGFIVASNMEMSQLIETNENELLKVQSQLNDTQKQLERRTNEKETSDQALKQTMAERDALSQQLNDAVLASQEANDAVAQQVRRNEQYTREMESLAAEYEDLSEACAALEAQIAALTDEAARAAMAHEQQTLADAQRIAELEAALAATPKPVATPAPTPSPGPVAPIRRMLPAL